MDGSRDGNRNMYHDDNVEDDSGLELSLGLSCGGSWNKPKGTVASKPVAFGDGFADTTLAGEGINGKSKNGKASCLDAALKRFLQGGSEEHEDPVRVANGPANLPAARVDIGGTVSTEQEMAVSSLTASSVACLNSFTDLRAFPPHIFQGYMDKSAQLELPESLEGKGNPAILKELQIPPSVAAAAAAAWEHLAQQGMHVQIMDAARNCSTGVGSASGNSALPTPPLSPHYMEGLPSSIGQKTYAAVDLSQDARQNDADKLEQQQRRFQEARKKRKHLIEEQKQLKKVKKEDERTAPHGFRRPGSNTWVRGLEAPTPATLEGENLLLTTQESVDDGEQTQEARCAMQSERYQERSVDSEEYEGVGTSCNNSRGNESSVAQRLKFQEIRKSSPNSTAANGDPRTVISNAWQQQMMQAMANRPANNLQAAHDSALKNMNGILGNAQGAMVSSHQSLESPFRRETENASCHSSSTGTDSSGRKEEQSCGRSAGIREGEASSGPPMSSTGREPGLVPSSAPFLTPVAITSNAIPYPLPSFSVVPMPYSLPVPVPNPSCVQFPVGFSFPYLMQLVPSAEGQEHSSLRPMNTNAFQLPIGNGYPPFQIPPLETATSWIPVLRSPPAPTFCATTSGLPLSRTSSGKMDDENKRYQGGKSQEGGKGQSSAIVSGASMQGSHQLHRATSLSCTQDSAASFAQPSADGQLSSFCVSEAPRFGPCRTLSDPGDLRSFKEQGSISAFPGFAASIQAVQGPTSRHFSSIPDKGTWREEYAQYAVKGEVTAIQQVGMLDDPSQIIIGAFGGEDFRWVLGGPFQKGSTDNLFLSEGLPQELSNLRSGIPTGLKFGGTGSSPDLPWVSTTGPGPNAKTICGVLYRFNRNQVKIVCACHGRHMSPSEFVQHAGGVEISNPEKNIVVNAFPLTSQAASAQG